MGDIGAYAPLLSGVGASSPDGAVASNSVSPDIQKTWIRPSVPQPSPFSPLMSPSPVQQIQSQGQSGTAGLLPEDIGGSKDPDKHQADATDNEHKAVQAATDAQQYWQKAEQSRAKAREAARQVAAVQNPTPPSGVMPLKQSLLTAGLGALLGKLGGGGMYGPNPGMALIQNAQKGYQAGSQQNYEQALLEAQRQKAMGAADQQGYSQDAAAQAAVGNQLNLNDRQFGVQDLKNSGMITKQRIASMSADERNLHTVAGRAFVAQLAQHGVEARALITQLAHMPPEARGSMMEEALGHPLPQDSKDALALMSADDYLKYAKSDEADANANFKDVTAQPTADKLTSEAGKNNAQAAYEKERTKWYGPEANARIVHAMTLANAALGNMQANQTRAGAYAGHMGKVDAKYEDAQAMKAAQTDLHNRNVFLSQQIADPKLDPDTKARYTQELEQNTQQGTLLAKAHYNAFLGKAQHAIQSGAPKDAVDAQFFKDTGQHLP